MTTLHEAAQQALEALELYVPKEDYENRPVGNVIDALRAALAEPLPLYGWVFKRNADGTVGIFAPPPRPGESQRTSDCVGPGQRDLHELLGKLADHTAALEQPFSPEAIRTTQAAWKMGYEARKAEEQPEPDSPERRCGGPGCDMKCCQPVQEPWEHLKQYGYAPGSYMSRCHICDKIASGVDKRAITCRPCAEVRHAESEKAKPVQEPDDKAASIRWQLCLLAQTEEFSDDVRNQIGRGVWLIDRLRAELAEPVQEPATLPGPGLVMCPACCSQFDPALNLVEPVREPALTVDALRVEFECRYRGKLGITRVEGGAYLSPAIETEWQQFVRKHTAPPQRLPLTEEEIQAAWDSVDMRHPRGNETRIAFARAVERAHKIGGGRNESSI